LIRSNAVFKEIDPIFVRPYWQLTSLQDALSLIDEHPWALLVSNQVQCHELVPIDAVGCNLEEVFSI
jgi:hypothetical protein